MTGVKSLGQDAIFNSNLCWVWWPDKAPDFGYSADCLDGKTGLKINYQDSTDIIDSQVATSPSFSECSTFALFRLNMEILQSSGVSNMATWKSESKSTLSDMRELKRRISAQYELAKADFFRHRVFGQWSCRDCRY